MRGIAVFGQKLDNTRQFNPENEDHRSESLFNPHLSVL